jgi:hypothetical protein
METYAEFSDGISELAENAMKTLGPIELTRLSELLRTKAVELESEADEQDEDDTDEDEIEDSIDDDIDDDDEDFDDEDDTDDQDEEP